MNIHDPDIESPKVTTGAIAGSRKTYTRPEAAPDLRSGPAGTTVVFDDIMDALRTLDQGGDESRRWRKAVRRRTVFGRGPQAPMSGLR